MADSTVTFNDVHFVRNGRHILNGISWHINAEDRWVVMGPNGAGKTTLLAIMGTQQYPTSGTVDVLGERLGHTNIFDLRPRIGVASSLTSQHFPPNETVHDLVLTAAYGVSGRWNEAYDSIDEERTAEILASWGLESFADKPYRTLSDGERKRAQIARAVMPDPELLLLDEPSANLDLGAREEMLARIAAFAQSPYAPALVVVTHHVEEIPVGTTHALLLKDGEALQAGPIESVVTSENLSNLYAMQLRVERAAGRYFAFRR